MTQYSYKILGGKGNLEFNWYISLFLLHNNKNKMGWIWKWLGLNRLRCVWFVCVWLGNNSLLQKTWQLWSYNEGCVCVCDMGCVSWWLYTCTGTIGQVLEYLKDLKETQCCCISFGIQWLIIYACICSNSWALGHCLEGKDYFLFPGDNYRIYYCDL